MKNTLHMLQDEIEQHPHLPVMPPNISYLLKTLQNNNISYAQLAKEIEKFPSIAVKIVATANSAWASPVAPITSVRDACARVGLPLVRSISIALSLSQIFDPTRCPSFNPKTFWVSALLTAEAAYICAKSTPQICPDTARLAGLLHNMGLLWLADKKSVETSYAIDSSKTDNISLTQTLSENHNLDIYTVGSVLASAMELPEIIVSTIASCSIKNNSEEILSKNHRYACQMASSVLLHVDSADIETSYPDDNQYSEQLANMLPAIQAMAQVLFFN